MAVQTCAVDPGMLLLRVFTVIPASSNGVASHFPHSDFFITPTELLSMVKIVMTRSSNNKSNLLNFKLNFHFIYLFILCVHTYVHECTGVTCMWRPEDTWRDWFSFYHVGPGTDLSQQARC